MKTRFENLYLRLAPGLSPLTRQLKRLHRDDGGATLTEFIIMLPIFLMVFNGVMILGEFTRKGTEAPIIAYKETFKEVLPFQDDNWFAAKHMQPTIAAADAGLQLAGDSKAHNISGAVTAGANLAEGSTYLGMGLNGTMGESFSRANMMTMKPSTDLQGCESNGPSWPSDCFTMNDQSGPQALSGSFIPNSSNGKLTSDLKDLTGDSEYAYTLFNDGPSVQAFSGGGGGILGTLNAVVTGLGIRPALAANSRYGTVSGMSKETFTFAGISMEMEAHYNVLVPPSPKGPMMDEMTATAISRLSMVGQDHYDDVLGIAWNQPLGSENLDVPDYH
ncbi:TadE/TadG family type IV pilus assembly protein [Bradymonas sediminis]|uniref:TadE/TadG family type IV pilus assembly protein n=1 Tax=Bradymonas sediminis TaxID=1548548 RepID=UPI00105C52E9|nr:hypothetical protein [Bradymonas sediminis]TDP75824.1 hypothetical protein DFR33_103171 [Bradymonas sediminis]